MNRLLARACATAGTALLVPLMLAPGASWADPSRGDTFQLTCGSTTWTASVNGNGEWTPAHDNGGTGVLVPITFGGFHGEIRDAQGNLVDSFDEPPGDAKGSGKQKANATCTYTFHDVSDGSDPEFPAGYTFHGSGTVTGRLTGR